MLSRNGYRGPATARPTWRKQPPNPEAVGLGLGSPQTGATYGATGRLAPILSPGAAVTVAYLHTPPSRRAADSPETLLRSGTKS
jgi:hypothetical protein